jgi:hypothetical protein
VSAWKHLPASRPSPPRSNRHPSHSCGGTLWPTVTYNRINSCQPALREPGLPRLRPAAGRGTAGGAPALSRESRGIRGDLHAQRDGRPAPGGGGLPVRAAQQAGDVAGQPQLRERSARVRPRQGSCHRVHPGERAGAPAPTRHDSKPR